MARVKRQSVQKAVTQRAPWKLPGFNAFGTIPTKRRATKLAKCRAVQPPEEGIHSFALANAIAPQDCALLKLPIEVRERIWMLVLSEVSGEYPIAPLKKGKIFYSKHWPEAARDTTALSESCRQIYVDCVGGSLLYKAKQFSFTPGLLLNYLWIINPVHEHSIRSTYLNIQVNTSLSLLSKAFVTLAEFQGLQDLHLEFTFREFDCRQVNNYLLGAIPTYNGRFVRDSDLTKIRACNELREIRGLQSLVLDFVTHTSVDGYEYRKIHLSAVGHGPYHDLEQELKQVVLA